MADHPPLTPPPIAPSPPPAGGPLAPFSNRVFLNLWLTWAAANLTMWMNDVAAAWLMTSLTSSPVMVALVQTASTLPVFLLGLPSGALADILDRRKYYAATQAWVALVACVLAAMALAGALTAPLLLLLTFANGIGLALRWPVFSAIVPSLVGRAALPQALALNGISMNLARVVGPVLAGALLSAFGVAAVFALNALLALAAAAMILRWRAEAQDSALPGERFLGAMRVGLQHVRQSPRMRLVLLRIFLFFLQTAAAMSLLPLIAKRFADGAAGPHVYTAMLASTGIGAIVAALYFPKLRARFGRDTFVRSATLLHAAASCTAVLAPTLWLALPAFVVVGMAWISVANTLSVSAQLALPDWERARGMSVYQMALMGGAAAGAVLWGQVAARSSVTAAVVAAAALGSVVILATRHWTVEGDEEVDHTPQPVDAPWDEPPQPIDGAAGPVMVTIEYRVDPARRAEFDAVMRETRAARRRQGVLSWGLFRDAAQPDRVIEYFVDENWTEHQRRLDRFTVADAGLRERRHALHLGPEAPRVRRYVAERLTSASG